jgi:hypothetical protein
MRSVSWPSRIVLAVLGVAALLVPASAQAEPSGTTETGKSCVYFLEPAGPKSLTGEVTATPTLEGCYSSYQAARSAAPSITPASSWWLATDWGHIEFGGESLVWYGASPCTTTTYLVPYMPEGWNDRARSAAAAGPQAANCNHFKHWENNFYNGVVLDCGGSCASMGVMSAQTSSEKIFHN